MPFASGVIMQIIFGDSPIYAGIGYILGGIIVWIIGKKWHAEPKRILTDNQTGEQVELKYEHSLLWIKLEYWAVIAIVVGIAVIASELD